MVSKIVIGHQSAFLKPFGCNHQANPDSVAWHLHRHDFQVVEIDGEKVSRALRDTLMVPPRSKMTVAFDANDTGMFTVVKYDHADTKFWQPAAPLALAVLESLIGDRFFFAART
jgi:hypothetical protein